MASAASRVGQKFRESVGLASTTVDPDVVKVLGNLKDLESDVALLRKVMETANKTLNRTLPDARAQAVQLLGMMGAKLVIRPDETEVYAALKDAHEVLDVSLSKKFSDIFEKVVLSQLEEWAQEFDVVRADMKVMGEKRLVFDHYREKVESMRDAKRKAQAKGQVSTKPDEEKLARNEEKLVEAEAAYNLTRDRALGRSLALLEESAARLSTVVQRFAQMQTQVYKDSLHCVRALDDPVAFLTTRLKDRRGAVDRVTAHDSATAYVRTLREAGKPLKFESLVGAVEVGTAAVGYVAKPVAHRVVAQTAEDAEFTEATSASSGAAKARNGGGAAAATAAPAAAVARSSTASAPGPPDDDPTPAPHAHADPAPAKASMLGFLSNPFGTAPAAPAATPPPPAAAPAPPAAAGVTHSSASGSNPFGVASTAAVAVPAPQPASNPFGLAATPAPARAPLPSSAAAAPAAAAAAGWDDFGPSPAAPAATKVAFAPAPAAAPASAPAAAASAGFDPWGGSQSSGLGSAPAATAPPAAAPAFAASFDASFGPAAAVPAQRPGLKPLAAAPSGGAATSAGAAAARRRPGGAAVAAPSSAAAAAPAFPAAAALAHRGFDAFGPPPPTSGGGGGFGDFGVSAAPARPPPAAAPVTAAPNPFGDDWGAAPSAAAAAPAAPPRPDDDGFGAFGVPAAAAARAPPPAAVAAASAPLAPPPPQSAPVDANDPFADIMG